MSTWRYPCQLGEIIAEVGQKVPVKINGKVVGRAKVIAIDNEGITVECEVFYRWEYLGVNDIAKAGPMSWQTVPVEPT